jgi:pimeloyl-ACP methyl ester carboxylesterase
VLGSPAGVRLLSLECRGHGFTAPLGDVDALTFATFAEDVRALLEHVGVEKAVVGGTSMGAGVALNLAVRFPERVSSLVLVRPSWLDAPNPPHLAVYREIVRLLRQHDAALARELFEASEACARVRAVSSAAADSLLGQFSRPNAQNYLDVLERLPADFPVPAHAWRDLKVPTLVLGTDRDPTHPLEIAQTLALEIPTASFQELTPRSLEPERHEADTRRALHAFLARSQV